MTINQLKDRCKAAMEHPIVGGPEAQVTLVIPGTSSAATRRLCGRRGPKGENFADVEGGNLVSFKAREILEYLEYLEKVPVQKN